jgi:hypothetical protein
MENLLAVGNYTDMNNKQMFSGACPAIRNIEKFPILESAQKCHNFCNEPDGYFL